MIFNQHTTLPPRERLEAAVQALIDLLDAMDAPTEDLEPDDQDCCAAYDDCPQTIILAGDYGPGDPGDAEDDDGCGDDDILEAQGDLL